MSYQNSRGRQDYNHRDDDRERSRSRDFGYNQGPPGGHRGGGRGGGSFGGRGGGGSRGRSDYEEVMLNFFKLNMSVQHMSDNCTWVQYYVSIFHARRTIDQTSELPEGSRPIMIIPKDSRKMEGTKFEMDFDKGSTPLSRRILNSLRREIFDTTGVALVCDGGAAAYAPSQIIKESGSDPRIPAAAFVENKQALVTPGIYGPSDVGIPTGGHQGPQVGLTWYYCVKALTNCDESDEGAESAKKQWFIVRVREVGIIQATEVTCVADQLAFVQQIKQCLETMLKSSMYSSPMISVGKSPHFFYLPPEMQLDRRVLGPALSGVYLSNREQSFAPFVGMSQAIRVCQDGNVFLNVDVGLSWFLLENKDRQSPHPAQPVMLLDRKNRTICGVSVGDLSRPIKDPRTVEAVKAALKKCNFHVRYTLPWSREDEEEFRNTLRAEGKDQDTIEKKVAFKKKKRTRILNNQNVMWKNKEKPGVIMEANNPDLHSFELTPRKGPEDSAPDETPIKYSVAQYFAEKRGLPLEFPFMPMVLTSEGYFPVEFLRQAFGKMKDANSPEQVKHVLGFNDNFASTRRLDHLAQIKQMAEEVQAQTGQSSSALLSQFNVKIENEPLTLKAKVLKEPNITFHNKIRGSLRDGSWNLLDGRNDLVFSSPAKLMSFAAIDFAGNWTSMDKFITMLTSRMKAHGMQLPKNISMRSALPELTVKASSNGNPAEIFDAFKEAIFRARNYFLRDSSGFFKKNGAFFRTNVISPDGDTTEGIIFPWLEQGSSSFEVVLPQGVYPPTHAVDLNGQEIIVRKMALVSNHASPVDLFDMSWNEQGQCTVEGQPVSLEAYVWISEEGSQIPMEAIKRPVTIAEDWQIECPSVVFCQLPDDGAGRYNLIKLMSNFEFGVQSQCFLGSKFSQQKSPDQYCSNIALKLNAKLSSKHNCAYAWDVDSVEARIPWLEQAPTMVMGLSMARASGQESQSVVAASACLQNGMQMAQAYRLQQSPSLIEPGVLNLAIQYYLHTGEKLPKRIIVYRNGASEGNFDALLQTEVTSIRHAFAQLRAEHGMDSCHNPKCRGIGCAFCTPIITFVVALSQHNIRMVPRKLEVFGKKSSPRNVVSGTCVDHTINAFWDSQGLAIVCPSEDEQMMSQQPTSPVQLFEMVSPNGGYDFLLTAHGGIKGTSKPIFYRVILNENVVWKPDAHVSPLTKEIIQEMTYHMSYQYATATKAVRMVPVVYYSNKLANVAVGYIGYLTGQREIGQRLQGLQVLAKIHSEDSDKVSFIRKDMEQLNLTNDSVKTELLPAFSPYDPENFRTDNPWRASFFTHMSA